MRELVNVIDVSLNGILRFILHILIAQSLIIFKTLSTLVFRASHSQDSRSFKVDKVDTPPAFALADEPTPREDYSIGFVHHSVYVSAETLRFVTPVVVSKPHKLMH